ncbi:MAG TPA: NUDIX domain-containing protein [Aliidongia sp.]|nr:NUDIX domain-containing protein [Aliidongia sp.]
MSNPAITSLDEAAPLAVTPVRNVAAAVLVAEDGRYLLQLRDDKPGLHLAGHWALFGGALEPGETAADGLRRELIEELDFTAGPIEPLAVSIHAVAPALAPYRMHFFAVPFQLAELDFMVQTEGAGKGLFTIAEACALARIAPWDLCALLLHARRTVLFPDKQGD